MTTAAVRRFRSMATDVVLQVERPGPQANRALDAAAALFGRIERACTRFDDASPLMRANADPRRWHEVPDELYAAVQAASLAHESTVGRFDPRILTALKGLGYDVTFSEVRPTGPDSGTAPSSSPRCRGTWRPGLDARRRRIRIGPDPIDLGGIGKGLAVTWAARLLAEHGDAVLVEAGGDLQAVGHGPDGDGWQVGVEDPAGGTQPVAVVRLADGGVATSSIRLRHWERGGRQVHHILDPRTGRPADSGLVSVTVVDAHAGAAEVWSKALFVVGRGSLRGYAEEHGIAALWVDEDGWLGVSPAMQEFLVWRRDPAQAVAAGA